MSSQTMRASLPASKLTASAPSKRSAARCSSPVVKSQRTPSEDSARYVVFGSSLAFGTYTETCGSGPTRRGVVGSTFPVSTCTSERLALASASKP